MIKSFYGDNGGLGKNIPANRKSNTWGVICGLDKELSKVGIALDEILCFDSSRNCWNWILDPSGVFTVRSLRKEIDSHILEAHPCATIWCNDVERSISSSGAFYGTNCLLETICS